MHCESNGAQTQHHREDIVKMQGEHEPLHEANEHDPRRPIDRRLTFPIDVSIDRISRSEEHTSELQSPCNLVCRLLLEKKKKKKNISHHINSNIKCRLCIIHRTRVYYTCLVRCLLRKSHNDGSRQICVTSRRLTVYNT